MWSILKYLKKNLVWSIPSSMILGILSGYFLDLSFMKAAIIPISILMIYPIMATVDIKSVFNRCSFKLQFAAQIINFLIIPFLGYGLGLIFFKDMPLIAFGLLLIALLPTSGMTVSWTSFAKGNVDVAIKKSIIGLIAGTLIAPIYGKFLMGTVINIPLIKTFEKISIVIFLPLILGFFTRIFLLNRYGKEIFEKDLKQRFPLISTLAVLLIIFTAMALKAKIIVANPMLVVSLLLPLCLFYLINYAVTSIIGKIFFKKEDAIVLVYGSVMRNLSVALAIAMTVFGKGGSEIALIIAVAYVIQVQSAAMYMKFSHRIFRVVD